MKPHKHAEFIKAWADGAEIEAFDSCIDSWTKASSPSWGNQIEYRIKPERKPDVVLYSAVGKVVDFQPCSPYVFLTNAYPRLLNKIGGNLKLTFDGETGELKSAEVLK
jgi:hypothetical protein